MLGKRVNINEDYSILKEGEFGKDNNGNWYARPPGAGVANLKNHEVLELPDGTISVWPSILVQFGKGQKWHGYLKQGVWIPS